MINVDCTVQHVVFSSDGFKILSCSLNKQNDEIILNKFGNFTIKGDTFLGKGNKAQILVTPNKPDKYGMSYNIISTSIDIDNLDSKTSYSIMCEVTTETQAKEVLSVYPNFVNMIIDGKEKEIDVKKLHNIGEYRLNAYVKKIHEKIGYFKIKMIAPEYGLMESECKDLIKHFQSDAKKLEESIKTNPYLIFVLILNRDFDAIDSIILEHHPEFKLSKERAEALIFYVLKLNEDGGSTAISKDDVIYYAKELNADLDDCIDEVLNISEYFYIYDTGQVSLMSTYVAEQGIYDWCMQKLQSSHTFSMPSNIDFKDDNIELTNEQINGIENAFNHGLSVLCGKAGTGKTSVVSKLIECIEKGGYTYRIVSPTGKAAKRVTEVTGANASTIHRVILSNPIYDYFLIVDETSMVNLSIFSQLINHIHNPNCHVVLIGDNAQLMPIGCGNVFNDIIGSNKIPIVNLTKVFRYNDKGIEYVATNIHQGKSFLTEYKTSSLSDQYTFIETTEELDVLVDEYVKLIKQGISPSDILCLSPYNVGGCGSFIINSKIQNILNPSSKNQKVISYYRSKNLIEFRKDDIVLCKKNDYDPEFENYEEFDENFIVVNGQDGIVHEIFNDRIVINFKGKLIVYPKKRLNELLLGYCISVHSSQGSEAKYVLSITSKKHSRMLNRNLCYVSSTRSKYKHIEIGSIQAMNKAIRIDGNEIRETKLYDMLVGETNENE